MESFLPNTDNFLAFYIAFECGKTFESAMAKHEKHCNAQLSFIYFSVNVSVLAVLFRRQLSKKTDNFRQNCRFF